MSQFILDNLSLLDFTITYRPGKKLVEADGVSRFPCLGPLELSPDGVKEAFGILLAAIPPKWNTEGRIWVNAQKETELIQQMVRQWMTSLPNSHHTRKVPILDTPTEEKILRFQYGIAFWSPPADKLNKVVNTALRKNLPFACLTPSCLVDLIPEGEENINKMKSTTKIVMLRPEITWVIHGIPTMTHKVLAIDQETDNTFAELKDLRGIIKATPDWDLRRWIPLQEKMIKKHPDVYTSKKIFRRPSDNLALFKPSPDKTLALVPKEHTKELVMWQHHRLCHGGAAKVYHALAAHWHWVGMKQDVRKIVENCAPCQLLKAKRNRAHHHFRAKVFCTPRTIWGCDFYGVLESRRKYNNLLGAIDLATAECRLFACQERTAATVTRCILHGIVLRDGCPLHIHSDAAREFISKAMNRLCALIGCKKTTTLAHHPTGNAHIERLWQWVALCLRQMTKEQYQEWEKYVRLMEHVWNTSYHSVLKCTPFEAAHGIPARTVLDSWVEEERRGTTSRLMKQDDIAAMRATANAFVQQIENVRKEAAERTALLNRRGSKKEYAIGERVSFFIPPTEKEAREMQRKPKHLLQYRGPASVVEKLSSSTYQIIFEGRTYYRCFSELRPYRSTMTPIDLPMANSRSMQENRLIIGNFVSLCDSDDPEDDHFHLCKVVDIVDGKAILLNYATGTKNIKHAIFKVMYQEDSTLRYTTVKPTKNEAGQRVVDELLIKTADDFVDHYDIKMTGSMKISAKSQKDLSRLGLAHHVLGKTFP